MRQFVRRTVRLVVGSIVLGTALRIGGEFLRRRATTPGAPPIRVGSFDSWPAVPVAPGRQATGA